MKRSGQPKPFRTIGTRMRDFGRSMMRHYVPPQEVPPSVEPPPPAWSAAAQTPLVWPEPDAPAGFAAEAPPAPLDAGFVDAPETQDFAAPPPQRRAPRPPAPPQQPPPPQAVQRKPAPPNSVDERLKNILAMHQEREAERQRVRDEKKTAFNAAEIQRQADPDAPHRPRRGRMAVDYVETSALSHGEEPPPPKTPAQSVQREAQPAEQAAPDAPSETGDDTAQLDPSEIQASLDALSLQRELSGTLPEFEEDYIPAGDEDAQAFFDSPPDWSEDSGDEGTPPPVDVPPMPMPPQGSAQRMPSAPSTDDFADSNTAESEYPYQGDPVVSDTPPATDMISLSADRAQRVQRDYTPAEVEPDFGGAADFEPTYDDAPDAEFLNPPVATAQRDYQPSSPDFSTETGNDEQSDTGYTELPTFDMDEGETRPITVQRAPILPPPDFADDSIDVPPAEMGYDSLADWVDAHSEAPDMPISGQPPGSVQRESQPPVAPDFSLQTGDYNQADFARSTAAYFEEDESDTRPIDVQRAFHEPDFRADADYQPAYPVDDGTQYADYSDEAASETTWSGDVSTPPADTAQREYESPAAESGYHTQDTDAYEIEQGYIEPADARPFFEDAAPDADAEWGGAGSTQLPAGAVQRDYQLPQEGDSDPADTLVFDAQDHDVDDGAHFGYENAPESAPGGDSYTLPAVDTIQRDYEMPAEEADYGQEAPASEGQWSGDVYTPPTDTSQTATPEDAYDASQQHEYIDDAPEGQWGGGVSAAPPAEMPPSIQRDYESQPAPADGDTYDADQEDSAPGWGWDAAQPPPADQAPYDEQSPANPWGGDVSAPPAGSADAVQRDYEPPTAPDANMGYGSDAGYDDSGQPPVDLYQAMMGAGMISSDEGAPDTGWGGDANAQPGLIQRTPEDHAPNQPVDVFQAMMQTGMVQPAPDDPALDTYYPPDVESSMSAATRADLLSLLDAPAPRGSQASPPDFTPDVSQPTGVQNTVSRAYQPPPQTNPPPVIQRAENEPDEGQQNDVNVDQLARDVYSVLRNRLRIERERRDRKS